MVNVQRNRAVICAVTRSVGTGDLQTGVRWVVGEDAREHGSFVGDEDIHILFHAVTLYHEPMEHVYAGSL